MASTENPYAGQGPVLLDIGGDVGALVVSMPASTEGLEVEIRPAGAVAQPTHGQLGHDPDGTANHHDHGERPHVGVVGRPTRTGVSYALVYPAVVEGEHELLPLPDGPVVMTVTVSGGEVTRARWPDGWA
ncbi:hypothetical protein [Terrabacter sp. BE26]|uniref:hypothetical protein n=1 Tax=Terrabacter sp. BE26 TaxID=2898152 RepID=UPI0035BE96B8